jgi:hypothetical protein
MVVARMAKLDKLGFAWAPPQGGASMRQAGRHAARPSRAIQQVLLSLQTVPFLKGLAFHFQYEKRTAVY